MSKTFALSTISLFVLMLRACGPLTNSNDVVVSNPKQAVADARKLINEFRASKIVTDTGLRGSKNLEELPESLRILDLKYCLIFEDHLELILARNPDFEIGARIWSLDSKQKHEDQPTRYPEIFFFDYNNDSPTSPTNIP
jgi:hypothetical protein